MPEDMIEPYVLEYDPYDHYPPTQLFLQRRDSIPAPFEPLMFVGNWSWSNHHYRVPPSKAWDIHRLARYFARAKSRREDAWWNVSIPGGYHFNKANPALIFGYLDQLDWSKLEAPLWRCGGPHIIHYAVVLRHPGQTCYLHPGFSPDPDDEKAWEEYCERQQEYQSRCCSKCQLRTCEVDSDTSWYVTVSPRTRIIQFASYNGGWNCAEVLRFRFIMKGGWSGDFVLCEIGRMAAESNFLQPLFQRLKKAIRK